MAASCGIPDQDDPHSSRCLAHDAAGILKTATIQNLAINLLEEHKDPEGLKEFYLFTNKFNK